MALQIQNILKSARIANSRGLTSGVFSSSGFDGNRNQSNKLHLAVQREYPQAEQLPMPANINVTETARFSPLRNRDINSSAMEAHHEMFEKKIDVTLDQKHEVKSDEVVFNDVYLEKYDRSSAVNLCSVMQSTVPEPYCAQKLSHLNMPGGSWGQQTKYLSHELNSAHLSELRQEIRSDSWNSYSGNWGPKVD